MRVSRVMTRDVICIPPGTRISKAHAMMTELHIRHLLVSSGTQLYGVLSDRDMLKWSVRTAEGTLELSQEPVSQAMSVDPITCRPTDMVSKVADLMLKHRIDCVPVVQDNGTLIGLVTSSDLLELLVAPNQESEVLPFLYTLRTPDEMPVA